MFIIASHTVSFDQLIEVPTPAPTPSHNPVPHFALVTHARHAITTPAPATATTADTTTDDTTTAATTPYI